VAPPEPDRGPRWPVPPESKPVGWVVFWLLVLNALLMAFGRQ
jgi:hypothetical protein